MFLLVMSVLGVQRGFFPSAARGSSDIISSVLGKRSPLKRIWIFLLRPSSQDGASEHNNLLSGAVRAFLGYVPMPGLTGIFGENESRNVYRVRATCNYVWTQRNDDVALLLIVGKRCRRKTGARLMGCADRRRYVPWVHDDFVSPSFVWFQAFGCTEEQPLKAVTQLRDLSGLTVGQLARALGSPVGVSRSGLRGRQCLVSMWSACPGYYFMSRASMVPGRSVVRSSSTHLQESVSSTLGSM